MNSPLGTRNRPWKARISATNGEASASISAGQPVCFNVTDLGQVVLPSTATASLAHPLFAGIAVSSAAPGQPVEIICGGYVNSARILVRTRAASSDNYSSVASTVFSYGNLFTLDTVNNCLAFSAAGAASLAGPQAVYLETLGSIASQVSSSTITHTASTTTGKMFIRALT